MSTAQITFADHRDDEYFNSLCPPEKLAEIRATAQAAHDRFTPARHASFEQRYAAHITAQAERTRAAVRTRFLPHIADGPGLYDDETRTFVAYPADQVDALPERESISPEARVYRGVTWDTSKVRMVFEPGNPFQPQPVGAKRSVVTDSSSAVDDRLHMDDAELEYVHRDEDPALVEHRWNRPADELEILDVIAEEGLEVWNVEILTAFRRAQLHRLCQWYFDTDDYSEKEIVLRWAASDNGRYYPAEKLNVVEWVESLVNGSIDLDTYEQRGGTQLSGFYSAAQTIRYKLMRKDRRRWNLHTRILSSAEVREVAHRAVANVASSAVALYFEL